MNAQLVHSQADSGGFIMPLLPVLAIPGQNEAVVFIMLFFQYSCQLQMCSQFQGWNQLQCQCIVARESRGNAFAMNGNNDGSLDGIERETAI
jgi:hypothetical protein